MLKSKKLFKKTPTFVGYADNKIFAIGKGEFRLHILDLELTIMKVVDHQFDEGTGISFMKVSDSYVATGQFGGNVTVFDHNGNRVVVSYF